MKWARKMVLVPFDQPIDRSPDPPDEKRPDPPDEKAPTTGVLTSLEDPSTILLASLEGERNERAKTLLERMARKDIAWSSQGELTIEGTPVPGSDIKELIRDAVGQPIRGRVEFWRALGRAPPLIGGGSLPPPGLPPAKRKHRDVSTPLKKKKRKTEIVWLKH